MVAGDNQYRYPRLAQGQQTLGQLQVALPLPIQGQVPGEEQGVRWILQQLLD